MISIEAVAFLWALCATCLAWGGLEARRTHQTRQRMERLRVAAAGTAAATRVLDPRFPARALGAALRRRWPRLARRQGPLSAAASSDEMVTELIGWRALTILAGVPVALGVIVRSGWVALPSLVLLPLLGWIVFELWLRRRASERLRAIQGGLLAVVDLLALSLGAGMGLDRALRLICERVDSPLTEELRMVLAEIDLGIPRREAFTHLAERLELEDIRSLTTAIIQADELSMSIVDSMRLQARSLRVRRRYDAETAAQRAPVMMLLPMVLFVMPSLFIVILAPLVIQLMKMFPK
jgi:Flp pilus assembly protein TadB